MEPWAFPDRNGISVRAYMGTTILVGQVFTMMPSSNSEELCRDAVTAYDKCMKDMQMKEFNLVADKLGQ